MPRNSALTLESRRRSPLVRASTWSLREARLGVVAQQPDAIGSRRGAVRVAHGPQPMLGRKLEHLHAAELPLAGLARHIQDQVAIAHPRAASAAEAHVGKFAEGLLLLRNLLQRRRQELAEHHFENDQQHRRDRCRPRRCAAATCPWRASP